MDTCNTFLVQSLFALLVSSCDIACLILSFNVSKIQICHNQPVRTPFSAMIACIHTPSLWESNRALPRIYAQAPSLPNSFVQSSLRLISSAETVGLAPLTALMKSFNCKGGSRSLSESTSVHVISSAPVSPGEQGVNFSMSSSVTTYGLLVKHIFLTERQHTFL